MLEGTDRSSLFSNDKVNNNDFNDKDEYCDNTIEDKVRNEKINRN